ncbi:coiled-coil domain-containing protein 24 isoform X2 [Aplysia californica]|uniref:Coiled-coil domain-containing protein 24 isoform X2 n=1 Tax=Aplysia californica TaxID=6500 RepID=A0ABM0JUJ2_APLCA|nr:coiled-coil domain-containing protein 24 isoform X2 [Aplysia californica]
MQAYSPPPSLWGLVEQHVCSNEREELKGMLGVSLVDQSLELHDEVNMLLDIWREMRDEEENNATARRGLPEPPNQRERLIQEICFFVDSVKEKAKRKGFDPDHIFKKHNSSVLDYAKEQSRPGSSAGHSSRSSDGRETPLMVVSPDRLSAAYELEDGIEAVNKQLNYLDFDRVCENLRKTLEDEVNQLLRDIQFLQGCLDCQADVRDCITPRNTSREPTLTELREERSQLEKDLLSSDVIAPTPAVNKPLFNNTHSPTSKVALSSATPSRIAPLRADHNIGAPNIGTNILKISSSGFEAGDSVGHQVKLTTTDHHGLSPSGLRSLAENSNSGAEEVNVANRPEIGARATKSDGDVVSPHPSSLSLLMESGRGAPSGSASLPLPTPPSVSKRGDGVTLNPARRRTASPGRVRVVDVTKIVDSRLGKSCVITPPNGQSATVAAATNSDLSEQPLVSAHDGTAALRPSSANRFRKMVMGCRDGE